MLPLLFINTSPIAIGSVEILDNKTSTCVLNVNILIMSKLVFSPMESHILGDI